MSLKVSRVDVWAASMKDQPGGLAEKLAVLARAKVNLEFVISRRAPDRPGAGVVFLTPVKGPAQIKAAREAGFSQAKSLHSVRIEGPNQPGIGAKLTAALAASGINLRGLSGAAMGKRFVVYLALDSLEVAKKAERILKKL